MVKKTKGLDVRSPEDMKHFMALFEKHTLVIVLVHADYCGHCQTYKDRVWNDLQDMPNKKNGLAAIHYDQLERTPLANAKLKGYPSILLVRKKGEQTPENPEPLEMEEFQDEENPSETTNAMPNEMANKPTTMQSILTAVKPGNLLNKGPTGIITGAIDDIVGSLEKSAEKDGPTGIVPGAIDDVVENINKKSGEITPEQYAEEELAQKTTLPLQTEEPLLKKSRNLNTLRARRTVNAQNEFSPIPDPSKDILDSQAEEDPASPFTQAQGERPSDKGVAVGGSLYSSLLAAAGAVAPAVALTGAAMVLKRKTRRGKKMRGGNTHKKGRKGGQRKATRKSKAK